MPDPAEALATLVGLGADQSGAVALAVSTTSEGTIAAVGLATSAGSVTWAGAHRELVDAIGAVEDALHPRWVLWSQDTARALVDADVRVARCWDLAAVHRLLFGGWRAEPGRVWAALHDLPSSSIPETRPVDLFTALEPDDGDLDEPLRTDGHLRPEWTDGGWATPPRIVRWAELALTASIQQEARISGLLAERPAALRTARAESTAELLCAELAADGLPLNRAMAEAIVAGFVGPRPRTEAEAAEQRASRDDEVLRHAPPGGNFDLRSPGQVKSLLRFVGIEVPDTRAWRLEEHRADHPLVEALLVWRKAERVSTTYGYSWLDQQVDADGRLRGEWSGADGAAGRMTASAGLHNLPADLRPAVVAEPGHVFVRADLGQIEPRVLAAVSGDAALARATADDDMYAPVARQLSVDRPTAKVAVLGTMYGQTTGLGAHLLPRLRSTYPVAMDFLDDADRAGQVGRELRTYGGRLVRFGSASTDGVSDREARSSAAARGRYGRNAMIQGAAAELFKVWAVTVRARGSAMGARIVLCLHDELVIQAPMAHGDAVADLVEQCLQEAVRRWAPGTPVRFVADISVLARWSDAKD